MTHETTPNTGGAQEPMTPAEIARRRRALCRQWQRGQHIATDLEAARLETEIELRGFTTVCDGRPFTTPTGRVLRLVDGGKPPPVCAVRIYRGPDDGAAA